MELDKRIKSKNDILTSFDVKDAGRFLGQKGYFSDCIDLYRCLDNRKHGILTEIKDSDCPFKEDDNEFWRFFIPESLLENKKYSRPFSLIEFKGNTPKMIFPDDLIHFRNKNGGFIEYAQRYNGYIVNSRVTVICLGSREYSLEDLFENFEYLDRDGEWNTFGVEE